jgi:hypothetical protein
MMPFLSRAFNFAREDVLTLIENIWLVLCPRNNSKNR